MTEKYGLIEEQQEQPNFPVRNLLRVPHQGASLVVSRNAFGPDWFNTNVEEMNGSFSYPNTWKVISFREPTTAESISAIAYQFTQIAKPEILDSRWLQAGRVLRAGEGVWANMPKDTQGKPIIDEAELKTYLQGVEPVKVNKGNVYIVPNKEGVRDLGYAEYGSFEQGVQESATFAQGGLARILEHTEGVASNLLAISSKDNYSRGVSVSYLDKSKKPLLRVVELGSDRVLGGNRLYVNGNYWSGYINGYAVGVLNESAEGAS